MVSNFSFDRRRWELVDKQIDHMEWQVNDILKSKQHIRSHNINFLVLEKLKSNRGLPYDVDTLLEHFVPLDDEHISALRRIKAQIEILRLVVNSQ